MASLPNAGRIQCDRCFGGSPPSFDVTKRTEGAWRISANPLAWGNSNAEVVVLGFSKGPTQAGALQSLPHDEIAFKGSRLNVGKILSHVGLIPRDPPEGLKAYVGRQIADSSGRFHFGSLIRCTVERFEAGTGSWKGSGGGMLDRFVATSFGNMVARNCTSKYLAALPATTRLVVMFGLGTNLGYVEAASEVFQKARPGNWRRLNRVAYGDGAIVVVHVEHFASQGRLIPAWLGELGDHRAQFGILAREAVFSSGIKLANVSREISREGGGAMSGKVIKISAIGTRGAANGTSFTAVPDRSGRFVLNRKNASSSGDNTNLAKNKVYVGTLDEAAALLRTNEYLINLVAPDGSRALRELRKVKILETPDRGSSL